jgi:HK97 gp10 family phage protein
MNRQKAMRSRSVVVGSRKLRMTLQRMDKVITREVVEVMGEYAHAIQQTAAELVPKDTGNLQEAILSPRFVGKKSNGFGWNVGFRTKKLQEQGWYAHFVEFGTKGYRKGEKIGRSRRKAKRNIPARPAQPFLLPAMQINKAKFRPRLERAIDRALKHAARADRLESLMPSISSAGLADRLTKIQAVK